MFSRDELNEYLNQVLIFSPAKRWKHVYSLPDVEYFDVRSEERILILSGPLNNYEENTVIPVHPILFWVQSAMWISICTRNPSLTEFRELLDDLEDQDNILDTWIRRALCRPLLSIDFYETYNRLTIGRLPKALEAYEPVINAMCMEDDWNSKNYIARTAKNYVAFSWETSA